MGLRHLHLHCRPPSEPGLLPRRGGVIKLYDQPLTPTSAPHLFGVLTVPDGAWEPVLALLQAGAAQQRVRMTQSGYVARLEPVVASRR